MRKGRFEWIYLCVLYLTICSCDGIGLQEQLYAFADQQWSAHEVPSFTIETEDSLAYYQIYFVMRHTDSYPHKNIWIQYEAQLPGQKTIKEKMNLLLADDDKGWRGAAFSDIIEQRILLTKTPIAIKAGTCRFSVEQLMRLEPLPNVIHAGIRIEKFIQ
jgi:gliding motility-associated lipoprotein GldH